MLKKQCVCSWSLQAQDPGDLVKLLKSCGLDRTQLALAPFVKGLWNLDELINEFHSNEITLCSGMFEPVNEDYSSLETIRRTGGVRPDQYWETNQIKAKESAKIAQQLGIDLVTFHAGFIPDHDDPEYQVMADRIGTIGRVFADQGIKLALETGQERAEDLLKLLELPVMSGIGVNFDPANMILYDMGDPKESIELLKDRIVQVHMKDAIKTSTPGQWGQEVPAGRGEVDWTHFFSAIEAFPQPLNVVIEREAGDDRVNDIVLASELALKYGCTK